MPEFSVTRGCEENVWPQPLRTTTDSRTYCRTTRTTGRADGRDHFPSIPHFLAKAVDHTEARHAGAEAPRPCSRLLTLGKSEVLCQELPIFMGAWRPMEKPLEQLARKKMCMMFVEQPNGVVGNWETNVLGDDFGASRIETLQLLQ